MPNRSLATRWLMIGAVASMGGCTHSDALTAPPIANGPYGTGADVQLTLNANQDYWPIWTEDGRGILYAYVVTNGQPQHRCIGLLPAGGGTREWEFCDNSSTRADTSSSAIAYALGADGRLVYAEAVVRQGAQSLVPDRVTLWLADSATPLKRRSLLTLPLLFSSDTVSWLADIHWTGPATFVVLGQSFTAFAHCKGCGAFDSTWTGGGVVLSGTITASGATVQPISGTSGASGYSLAEGGASVVFTRAHDRNLYKVPVGGGAATSVATVTTEGELLGVSCKGSTCVVASDRVTLSSTTAFAAIAMCDNSPLPPISCPGELRTVSLATGTVQIVKTNPAIIATPQISPTSGDVVVQIGGGFGHLQTEAAATSDLHLYPGLVP